MKHPDHTIAIDGYSACGKSTLAKAMAQRLGYRYVDTGAMYRVVTLAIQRAEARLDDAAAIADLLTNTEVSFQPGNNHALLNGEDVEHLIRGLGVSSFVSPVATVPAVRKAMREQQRRMGAEGGVIMDGRDIGTVVFPDAELKLFVTANIETRTDRRVAELTAAGKTVNREDVRRNLLERDYIDSTREDSPLSQAEDAILLDNSKLDLEEFVELGMSHVRALSR